MAAAQQPMVDPQCASAVAELLQSKLPANQMMDQVLKLLQKHGLAHFEPGVTPSQVLCHPHNRSKQMLSYRDMWQKGCQMLQVGMRRQLLTDSMAIEVSHDQAMRLFQFEANQKLIDESNGAMAPLSGQERFLILLSFLTTKCQQIFVTLAMPFEVF